MKDLFEICGECRHLSDAEVVYQLTNNKETSNQVNAMLANGSNVSIEDILQLADTGTPRYGTGSH